jgi:hypothetical protein
MQLGQNEGPVEIVIVEVTVFEDWIMWALLRRGCTAEKMCRTLDTALKLHGRYHVESSKTHAPARTEFPRRLNDDADPVDPQCPRVSLTVFRSMFLVQCPVAFTFDSSSNASSVCNEALVSVKMAVQRRYTFYKGEARS